MRLVSSRGNEGARRGTQETAAHAKGRPQEEPVRRHLALGLPAPRTRGDRSVGPALAPERTAGSARRPALPRVALPAALPTV